MLMQAKIKTSPRESWTKWHYSRYLRTIFLNVVSYKVLASKNLLRMDRLYLFKFGWGIYLIGIELLLEFLLLKFYDSVRLTSLIFSHSNLVDRPYFISISLPICFSCSFKSHSKHHCVSLRKFKAMCLHSCVVLFNTNLKIKWTPTHNIALTKVMEPER